MVQCTAALFQMESLAGLFFREGLVFNSVFEQNGFCLLQPYEDINYILLSK